MAALTITVTVPDDKVTALQEAFGWVEGGRTVGTTPLTNAQIRAIFKDAVRNRLRSVYRQHQLWLDDQEVIDTDLGET